MNFSQHLNSSHLLPRTFELIQTKKSTYDSYFHALICLGPWETMVDYMVVGQNNVFGLGIVALRSQQRKNYSGPNTNYDTKKLTAQYTYTLSFLSFDF